MKYEKTVGLVNLIWPSDSSSRSILEDRMIVGMFKTCVLTLDGSPYLCTWLLNIVGMTDTTLWMNTKLSSYFLLIMIPGKTNWLFKVDWFCQEPLSSPHWSKWDLNCSCRHVWHKLLLYLLLPFFTGLNFSFVQVPLWKKYFIFVQSEVNFCNS